MIIELHQHFKKSYKNRIAKNRKLVIQTGTRIKLFQQDTTNPILKDHPLKGKKVPLRSFSITGDIRITYWPISNEAVIFFDIGTHNQVYR